MEKKIYMGMGQFRYILENEFNLGICGVEGREDFLQKEQCGQRYGIDGYEGILGVIKGRVICNVRQGLLRRWGVGKLQRYIIRN